MSAQPNIVDANKRSSNARVITRLLLVVVGMFGFGFALVPLYDVFCEVTGLNGKTGGRAELSDAMQVDTSREIEVEFVASLNANMPWEFRPMQHAVKVHPGKPMRIDYVAINKTCLLYTSDAADE